MIGIDRVTGARLDASSDEHLRQSVQDVLTTPRGSRVMRRDYGSDLPDLIDQPLNDYTRLRIFAATALALLRWEPRVRLRHVQLIADAAVGSATLVLRVLRTDLPRRLETRLHIRLGSTPPSPST